MRSHLDCYPFAYVLLILLSLVRQRLWYGGKTTLAAPKPTRVKGQPKPFAGVTRKPDCEACEQEVVSHPQAPGATPPRMSFTRGRVTAKSIRQTTSARVNPVRITAGLASGISAPTAISLAIAGDNSIV
jgi:hypothetical protein